jgi:hypothetical protein
MYGISDWKLVLINIVPSVVAVIHWVFYHHEHKPPDQWPILQYFPYN